MTACAMREGDHAQRCLSDEQGGVFVVVEACASAATTDSASAAADLVTELGQSLPACKESNAVEMALFGAHWMLRKRDLGSAMAAVLVRTGDKVVAGRAGDAAVYLLRGGKARCLLPGGEGGASGEVRPALGSPRDFEPDAEVVEVEDGDVLLLGTADVARYLRNEDIGVLSAAGTEEALEVAARGLLRAPGGQGRRGCSCQVVRLQRRRPRRAETGSSVTLRWAGATHCGLRSRNEDAMLLRAPVFAVADGMGGMADGAVAARLALDTVASTPLDGAGPVEWLGGAVRLADEAVGRRLGGDGGSTLDVLRVEAESVHLAHVGDGRAYRVRGDVVEQVTDDHNVAGHLSRQGLAALARARDHHTLTQALGTSIVEPQILQAPIEAGERWILATDGLSGVDRGRIGAILRTWDHELGRASRELVDEALRCGGTDNVTVVVVAIDDDERTGRRRWPKAAGSRRAGRS